MPGAAGQTSPLISAAALYEHLGDPGWVVVDCRHQLSDPDAGRAAYHAGHIPGARHAHLDRDLAKPPSASEGRHPLPDPGAFAKTLSAWGISNDAIVVAYDDASGAIAARLWWMLRWLGHERAQVLDGGLPTWIGQGLPLEATPPAWDPAVFVPGTINSRWLVSTDDLPGQIKQGKVLLDARAAERFDGRVEPIDPVAGHIPRAVNLPFNGLVDAHGRLLGEAELRARFDSVLSGRGASEAIAMCGSGVTACYLLLGMRAAGLGDGLLYAGSWSEWIRSPERPVEPKPPYTKTPAA
jgi:thiosulfate/3-mercaptopyruvate sulfurtransferase